MDRLSKEQMVSELHSVFTEATSIVVAHYSGLTVSEAEDLRRQMREAGAKFKVTKNRLTRLAIKGTKFEGLSELFSGPTAIAFSSDPVAPAKVAVNYSKTNEKLVVVGGGMEKIKLDIDGIRSLAALPSLDEIRAKMVGLINTPSINVLNILQAPGSQLNRVVFARSKQSSI